MSFIYQDQGKLNGIFIKFYMRFLHMISKNTFKIIALLIFSLLASCTEKDNKNALTHVEIDEYLSPKTEPESTEIIVNKENKIVETPDTLPFEFEILDSAINKILIVAGLEKKYQISYSHNPYKITGLFNNDTILDTAFLVKDNGNSKVGLIIRYGLSDPYDLTIFGAGKKVLGQTFDNLSWVGDFKIILKGSKVASNVDAEGEIITEEIPDSLKTELPNDGIFIHTREGCGGGIIYSDNKSYKWIQQE